MYGMNIKRPWAFWRQVTYFSGFGIFFVLLTIVSYFFWFHTPATCFDGSQNGDERGIDCGGVCARACLFDVTPPSVEWARSFKVTDGQYNAVAYVENRNKTLGTAAVDYTLSLYDETGLIVERTGSTPLAPDSVTPIFEGRLFTDGRDPIQTVLELDTTEEWFPATNVRSQIEVINRELKELGSFPRLEAVLRSALLTEIRDIEVVATIFDSKGNALTASQTVIPRFPPQSSAEIVFTWPEPIAKTIRSCEVPTDVIVAIDLSGSMNDDGEDPPEPLTSVLEAAEAFVGRLGVRDQAGVATFATDGVLTAELSRDSNLVQERIAGLTIEPAPKSSFTNTGAAFEVARAEFLTVRHNKDARKVLVLLTDGLATAPDEDNASSTPEERAEHAAALVKEADIEVFTIGLGTNVNEDFLTRLASTPDNYYQAISRSDINAIYTSITSALCEDGAAVIDIVPKVSPVFE